MLILYGLSNRLQTKCWSGRGDGLLVDLGLLEDLPETEVLAATHDRNRVSIRGKGHVQSRAFRHRVQSGDNLERSFTELPDTERGSLEGVVSSAELTSVWVEDQFTDGLSGFDLQGEVVILVDAEQSIVVARHQHV